MDLILIPALMSAGVKGSAVLQAMEDGDPVLKYLGAAVETTARCLTTTQELSGKFPVFSDEQVAAIVKTVTTSQEIVDLCIPHPRVIGVLYGGAGVLMDLDEEFTDKEILEMKRDFYFPADLVAFLYSSRQNGADQIRLEIA